MVSSHLRHAWFKVRVIYEWCTSYSYGKKVPTLEWQVDLTSCFDHLIKDFNGFNVVFHWQLTDTWVSVYDHTSLVTCVD